MSDITRDNLRIVYGSKETGLKRGANGWEIEPPPRGHRKITDEDVPAILRALEDDPIWWCFEHQASVSLAAIPHQVCDVALVARYDTCDIAKATRPRRIK